MSVFAGVVARRRGQELPAPWVVALRQSLSRGPGARVELLAGPGHAIVVDDFGIFAGGITRAAQDALSLLAGDPLLDATLGTRSRPGISIGCTRSGRRASWNC